MAENCESVFRTEFIDRTLAFESIHNSDNHNNNNNNNNNDTQLQVTNEIKEQIKKRYDTFIELFPNYAKYVSSWDQIWNEITNDQSIHSLNDCLKPKPTETPSAYRTRVKNKWSQYQGKHLGNYIYFPIIQAIKSKNNNNKSHYLIKLSEAVNAKISFRQTGPKPLIPFSAYHKSNDNHFRQLLINDNDLKFDTNIFDLKQKKEAQKYVLKAIENAMAELKNSSNNNNNNNNNYVQTNHTQNIHPYNGQSNLSTLPSWDNGLTTNSLIYSNNNNSNNNNWYQNYDEMNDKNEDDYHGHDNNKPNNAPQSPQQPYVLNDDNESMMSMFNEFNESGNYFMNNNNYSDDNNNNYDDNNNTLNYGPMTDNTYLMSFTADNNNSNQRILSLPPLLNKNNNNNNDNNNSHVLIDDTGNNINTVCYDNSLYVNNNSSNVNRPIAPSLQLLNNTHYNNNNNNNNNNMYNNNNRILTMNNNTGYNNNHHNYSLEIISIPRKDYNIMMQKINHLQNSITALTTMVERLQNNIQGMSMTGSVIGHR